MLHKISITRKEFFRLLGLRDGSFDIMIIKGTVQRQLTGVESGTRVGTVQGRHRTRYRVRFVHSL